MASGSQFSQCSGRTVGGNSLSLENLNSYVEIMKETERTLEGIVVDQTLERGY